MVSYGFLHHTFHPILLNLEYRYKKIDCQKDTYFFYLTIAYVSAFGSMLDRVVQPVANTQLPARDVTVSPNLGQIGPKWDKSGTFKDQFSVHFGVD